MKKTYQKPSIKVIEIEAENLLQASGGSGGVNTGGNTGITTGGDDPPSSGNAKPFFDFNLDSEPSSTGIDWDD